MKKLYQVLIILDDLADMPQLHKPNGALDTLFIRGRHMQISTWVSSQKLRLISAAVRVNMQFLCCWRLRNQHSFLGQKLFASSTLINAKISPAAPPSQPSTRPSFTNRWLPKEKNNDDLRGQRVAG